MTILFIYSFNHSFVLAYFRLLFQAESFTSYLHISYESFKCYTYILQQIGTYSVMIIILRQY